MEELSFSKRARLEALDNFKFSKDDGVNLAFLKGFFISEMYINKNEITFQADLEKTVKTIKKLLNKYNVISTITQTITSNNKQAYLLEINDFNKIKKLMNSYESRDLIPVNQYTFTGLFVAEARLTNPEKIYQLEFVFKDIQLANDVKSFLLNCGYKFNLSSRKNLFVVYTKQSEIIEDVLATVGAQNACLEIMSGKVVKDIRNRMNRITNCDAANIAKTVKAGRRHIEAIESLMENDKFNELDKDLKIVAMLKLENPELSLVELGQICTPPLTKSSINRRLQKLCTLAEIKE